MRVWRYISLKRLGWGAVTGVLFVAAAALPAAKTTAHYVYESGYLYRSSEDCVWGRSEVSHGSGAGYSRSDIQAKYKGAAGGSDCGESFTRPSNYLKVRQIFKVQLTPGWGYCRDTGWLYNTNPNWVMTVTRNHGSNCGHHNYGTHSSLYELNGSWKGGELWSGSHWF